MNYEAGENTLMKKLRTKKYIAMFPEANVSRYWGNRLGIHFKDGWMMDGEFVDKLTPGFVEGSNTFDCGTMIWYLRTKHGIKGHPYDSAGMLTQLWFFESNIVDNSYQFQDLVNNQTHHVKYFTAALREILNHDNETLHALRREILAFDGIEPIDSSLVNGYDRENDIFIAVAGHIINMLLATHWTVIDLNRYMDTIEANVKGIRGPKPLFEADLQG